jgi:hypothetical protein
MLKRSQISFAVPLNDVAEPQFKVLIDGKLYGHAIERVHNGWEFYALGGVGGLIVTAVTLWDLVDFIIAEEHLRYGHMTHYNNQEKDMSKLTHNQFKVFTGPLGPNTNIDAIAAQVENFAEGFAAKSIGVEYHEPTKRLVVSLGYSTNGEKYPVKLVGVSLGRVEDLSGSDFSGLEIAMGNAAALVENVICHEMFITEDNAFFMVLLARA